MQQSLAVIHGSFLLFGINLSAMTPRQLMLGFVSLRWP